jgi:hypothetical protein
MSISTSRADPVVLDQLSSSDGGGLGCCLAADFAQTFTVGITGILRTIGLPLHTPPGPDDFSGLLGVQLTRTSAGLPSDTVLAEVTLPKSSLHSGATVEFTTLLSGLNVSIVSGEQLALVLSNVGHNGQNIGWMTDSKASYVSGAPYQRPRQNNGRTGDQGTITGPWSHIVLCCGDFDFSFFTLVEPSVSPAPTPEPSTILLFSTAILGLVSWYMPRRSDRWII